MNLEECIFESIWLQRPNHPVLRLEARIREQTCGMLRRRVVRLLPAFEARDALQTELKARGWMHDDVFDQ